MTHHHCMDCVCTAYGMNQSNRDGAMERTQQNLWKNCVTLTFDFWPENGAQHINTWVVCVPHMKWISQIGMEPCSGHGKKFERHMCPWCLTSWLKNDAWHVVTLWVLYVPHMKWIVQIRMEPQPQETNFQKLLHRGESYIVTALYTWTSTPIICMWHEHNVIQSLFILSHNEVTISNLSMVVGFFAWILGVFRST